MINSKIRKFIAIISIAIFAFGVFSIESFASVNEDVQKQNKPFIVIIKGKNNIEAYKKAGLIPTRNGIVSSKIDKLDENITGQTGSKGTNPPTSTWDLNNSSYNFSYSMSNYVYTNYKYYPYAADCSIYQDITPNTIQKLKIDYYLGTNNSHLGTLFNDYIDDDIAIGLGNLDIAKTYYFKYSSPNGTSISGSGTIY